MIPEISTPIVQVAFPQPHSHNGQDLVSSATHLPVFAVLDPTMAESSEPSFFPAAEGTVLAQNILRRLCLLGKEREGQMRRLWKIVVRLA